MPFTDHQPWDMPETCNHPEHDPPGMIVLKPGVHTYVCPKCGQEQRVIIPPAPTLNEFFETTRKVNKALDVKGLPEVATDALDELNSMLQVVDKESKMGSSPEKKE